MTQDRRWTSWGPFRYIAVGLLACALTFVPACSNSDINTTCTVISTAAAVATLLIAMSDPTTGADLAALDTNQSLVAMGLSNATVYSTSGNFTVTVKDASTGSTLGQQTFGYIVQGNSLYAQDPTALHNWLQQFSGYSSVDVDLQVEPQVKATTTGTVSATDNAEYEGTTYASATATWTYGGGGLPCHPCVLTPPKH